MRQLTLALLASGLILAAQEPRFEDFPAKDNFTGTPAEPILASAVAKSFRTRIRNGVKPGPGGHGRPNFAGRYFLLLWGCGSLCVTMAMVDAKTGIVFGPPFERSGTMQLPLEIWSDMKVDFRPDSSLLILRNACSNYPDRATCGVYHLSWTGKKFDVVKFQHVQPKY